MEEKYEIFIQNSRIILRHGCAVCNAQVIWSETSGARLHHALRGGRWHRHFCRRGGRFVHIFKLLAEEKAKSEAP